MNDGPLIESCTDLVLKGEKPITQGTRTGPDVRVHDVAPVGRSGRYTMTDLCKDHTLFSAALLAATGLAAAPVAVYWAESGLPEHEAPVIIDNQRIVLRGLQEPFDRVIYACPNEHAVGLLRFLDRFAVSRPDGVWESVHQVVPVIDWAVVFLKSTAPTVPPLRNVHLYGVESAHSVISWAPPLDPWKDPVCLRYRRKQAPVPQPKRRAFT